MNTEERIDLLLKSQETLTKLILNSQETAKPAPPATLNVRITENGNKPERRRMSLAGRERIAEAQRERWAKTHAAFGQKGKSKGRR